MKITGGELGGRRIKVPPRGVRPTQDRVRESVFGSLTPRMPGARVLDLFAGSGSLGLEAWSRGAAAATLVERHPGTFRVLRENVRTLAAEPGAVRCVCAEVFSYLRGWAGEQFDLVFADPPYEEAADGSFLEKILQALQEGSMLSADGLLIFETGKRVRLDEAPEGWTVIRDKTYGSTRVLFLSPSS